jgi:hypothetical protein
MCLYMLLKDRVDRVERLNGRVHGEVNLEVEG